MAKHVISEELCRRGVGLTEARSLVDHIMDQMYTPDLERGPVFTLSDGRQLVGYDGVAAAVIEVRPHPTNGGKYS